MNTEQQAKRRRTDSRPTSAPASAASSIGPPQPRYFNPGIASIQQPNQYYHHHPSTQHSYQQQQQQQQQQQPQQQSHQLGLVAAHAASASPGMPAMLPSSVAVSAAAAAVAAAAVVTTPLNPPRSTLPPQYITPHTIPATLLGQAPAVSNSDYNMWFYSQQQIPAPDRSVSAATAAAGGMVGSASVSPVSQHALASAEHPYPIQGHFDNQMRYMAVPSHPSGMPKPASSTTMQFDRTMRANSTGSLVGAPNILQPYQHSYQQTQAQTSTHAQSQMHAQYAGYYHHSQPHQQQSQQHQQPQSAYYHPSAQTYTHAYSQHQQHIQHPVHSQLPSPFPTQASAISAAAVAAAIGDTASSHTSVGTSAASSVLHTGAYAAVHTPTDQVSAAQVAAAVAAATATASASAHAQPISGAGPVVSAGSSTGSVVSRLGIGLSDIDQTNIPAFKFSMNMHASGDTAIPEYFENYTQSYMAGAASAPPPPRMLEPSPSSPSEQTLDQDLMVRLDELFMKYLEQICSNNITVDSEGELIHQTQMAKKLEKLEQCTEFRTFRFRIQAFSNGYREFIEREAGLTEQVVSKQQLRNYLHQQRYISRYNEDGKKAKSKGHHVWNVEAKKISRNTWWFKEFLRRIASPPPKAVIGVPYEWTPTIWDPQIKSPKVYFNSEWLPHWLQWDNNALRGLPPPDATDCNISVIASYYQGKEIHHLKTNFTIHVVPHTPTTTVYMS
ncbi:hypothetical protein LPJ57_000420 [Coemansia sp. RSA 486]|nr:hypothetical protein LPJ57_000420 [Coemansia sp. RSA 486]